MLSDENLQIISNRITTVNTESENNIPGYTNNRSIYNKMKKITNKKYEVHEKMPSQVA